MESGNCLIEVWSRVHLEDFAVKALSTNNILNLSKIVSKKEKKLCEMDKNYGCHNINDSESSLKEE